MQCSGNPALTAEAAWLDAMQRGDCATAWRVSDAVLAARDPAARDDPRLPYHRRWVWDGRAFDRRRVLVRCYHGLGDTLQFARYLPPLRARAARVTLEAPPELVPLLAGVPGVDRVVAFRLDAPLPPEECDIEIMELFHALRLSPARVKPAQLPAGPDCPLPGVRAALCWQAGDWDPRRSVPLAGLLAAVGPHGLLSLQRGPAAGEATAPAFCNPGDDCRDVRRTAGLLRAAPVVVTVDTMVAHLSGTLGRPTLLLLPEPADWRWGRAGATSVWYPSLRLLRQRSAGDWSGPLRSVRRALAPGEDCAAWRLRASAAPPPPCRPARC